MNYIKNAYFTYLLANAAKEFFKQKIIDLDKSNTFNRVRVENTFDPDDFEAEKAKYKRELSVINAELEVWRSNHPKYYRMQTCLPNSSTFNLEIPTNRLFDSLTLDDAIQGYKAANEVLKNIPNSDLDIFCTEIKPMLLPEFRYKYQEEVVRLRRLYNVPTDDEIRASLPIKAVNKYRLSLNRQTCSNTEFYDLFAMKYSKLNFNKVV